MVNGISSRTHVRSGLEFCNRALQWWLSELRDLPRSMFRFNGNVALEFEVSGRGEPLPTGEAAAHKVGGRRHVRLKLDDDLFLYRKIKLPAAALKNIERVIGYEFNKYFPMDSEAALFSCRAIQAEKSAASIEVEIWAISRATVDRHVSLLRHEFNLEIRKLLLSDRQGRDLITLDIEAAQRLAENDKNTVTRRVLNLSIAGLLAALIVYPLTRMDAYLERQQQEIARLEKRAQPVIELREKIQAITQRFDAVAAEKKSLPPRAEVWSRLTRSLSQRAVLNQVVFDGQRAEIGGMAASVESLLRDLESDPWILEVSIVGQVKTAREPGYENMKLSLTIKE